MPDLLVRNVPEDLLRRLREDARKHRRSASGEALDLLAKALLLRSRAEELESLGGRPFLLTRRWLSEAKRRGGTIRLADMRRRK